MRRPPHDSPADSSTDSFAEGGAAITLASGSAARAGMLSAAAIPFAVRAPRVDEDAVRAALVQDGAAPRDVADALAEMKAVKGSVPGLCLGGDQVLELDGAVVSKAADREAARSLLQRMAGRTHHLHAAAVLAEDGRPVWRVVETVRMAMRPLSDGYVDGYLARNWDAVRGAVGCYHIEGEGARLFTRIEGSHFAVLGLPLLPLIDHLVQRGVVAA